MQGAPVCDSGVCLHVNRKESLTKGNARRIDMRCDGIDNTDAALLRIEESGIVTLSLRIAEIADYLLLVSIRKETPHGIHVKIVKIGGVELYGIRNLSAIERPNFA